MENDKIKNVISMAILGIICVTSFLIAKYIVRMNIRSNEIPVDTSIRLE